ncbi:hypothetical protein FHG66_09240 [Rubellimicrobium rubrum]|uniref:Uncharacterized protein n=1 Tax=Rubellimicrobium rubrum TaxID=2585369 RepID=A0A5C4N1E9_9RHOB|nr:hypothetical protein [Rubellimicrobium rubrum]TNC50134.1 hypothetical protein FHG66_09240 [Rubellimicrobium rubrum]
MLPFHTVDHRIDHTSLPFEERRVLRRSSPERLRFDCPAATTQFLRLGDLPPPEPAMVRPSWLRMRLGSMLIAWGQRLTAPTHGL